jgi:ferredoxin
MRGTEPGDRQRLRVDWPSCQGRGLCHELLPELIDLDRWGYPLVLGDVPPELDAAARRAVANCPKRALRQEPG